jgi:hypothetical protein
MENDFVGLLLTPEVVKLLLESSAIQDLIIKPNKKEFWKGQNNWPKELIVLIDYLTGKSIPAIDIVRMRNEARNIKFKEKFSAITKKEFRIFIFDKIKLGNSFTDKEKEIILSPIKEWKDTGEISYKEEGVYWPGKNFFWTVAQVTESHVNRAVFWEKILF